MAPTVRAATVDDIPGIQRVARRGWRETYAFLSEGAVETILDDWYAADELEGPITASENVYLVAEADGIAGYASAAPTANEEAQLYAIYVDPDRWNDGLGTALLDAVRDRLSDLGSRRLRVEVLAENAVGVSFYESRGFERISEREREIGSQTLVEYVYYRDV
ncbi:GNAT family N-acetyltransferase [Halococcus qingdaonensis]|uniref:GNAT family N-acetyltransferase n=1 Tax=Halococcus qingdaonensis TaxID=224402 RepID=UPI0021165508|nr:GNAT family N-acetyltransferase [Halococcus qingdaonensis]